ncbi:MucR family transcriptional regulator [uncultured Brevundimonas sp.]|uniref:MucR family transcriptional regulator n=1 Tax=uncultured Brevundimonas sp. TaxID=213418 RepID=UPI0025E3BB28|nr:MucR family transcriptional regulator [uncultured Brevundimonas sp.]
MTDETQSADLIDMTVGIVANYVSNNRVEPDQVGALIASTYAALSNVGQPAPEPVEIYERATPAQIRKSMTDDGLVSFIDGRTYKTLKRHLATNGMTPAEYRDRYGLPDSYPITSPAYSARRSELAKSAGLGQKGRAAQASAAPKRGRPKS